MIFAAEPRLVNLSQKPFNDNRRQTANCLKGCKWAPDGSCLCTNSDDHTIRIYNLPAKFADPEQVDSSPCAEILPELQFREAQIIYDYCWYPLLNSLDQSTCFLACCSGGQVPIHLWDAYGGKLAASYSASNNVYELVSARSLHFTPDGRQIVAGYEKFISIFDISRPGLNGSYIHDTPNGIISSVACHEKVFAAGTFSRQISLYDLATLENVVTLQGHKGGITHLQISPCGNRLYSGARKDKEILCWDLRNHGDVLYTINRNCPTSQRIYFDIDFERNILVTGDDGVVKFYDIESTPNDDKLLAPCGEFKSHDNRVTGVSLHRTLPLIATVSGERQMLDFAETIDDEDDAEGDIFDYRKTYIQDNNLKLWWWPSTSELCQT